MVTIKSEITFVPELLRKRQYSLIIDELWHRVFSSSRFIGFQRDPHLPLEIPDVDLNLNMRPIQKSDYLELLDFTHQTSPYDIKYRLVEKAWLISGIKTCYVTETEEKIPCHLQWMIGPEENNRISRFTGGGLPHMSDTDIIDVPDLPASMRYRIHKEFNPNKTLFQVESEHIQNVLMHTGGNKTKAAEILNIDRKTLREKLKRVSQDDPTQS